MVKTGKDGKMYTEDDPKPFDREAYRREVRDHITGNGKPWHVDPNAAPAQAEVDVPLPTVCGCVWTGFGRVLCSEHAYETD